MNSYVYLITDGQLTKVGVSDNPQFRLKELQTGNPKELQLRHVYTCRDRVSAHWVESLIHKRFAEYRLSGEWFNISSDKINHDIAWALDIATGIIGNPRLHLKPIPKKVFKYSSQNAAALRVQAHLTENPDDIHKSVRDLAEIIGVGKSTVARVKAHELSLLKKAED